MVELKKLQREGLLPAPKKALRPARPGAAPAR
jgi:hypothetical protein